MDAYQNMGQLLDLVNGTSSQTSSNSDTKNCDKNNVKKVSVKNEALKRNSMIINKDPILKDLEIKNTSYALLILSSLICTIAIIQVAGYFSSTLRDVFVDMGMPAILIDMPIFISTPLFLIGFYLLKRSKPQNRIVLNQTPVIYNKKQE